MKSPINSQLAKALLEVTERLSPKQHDDACAAMIDVLYVMFPKGNVKKIVRDGEFVRLTIQKKTAKSKTNL